MKPDCYQCIHKGDVPGSAHSSCHHPAFGKVHDDPFLGMMAIFASVKRVPAIQVGSDQIKVVGAAHGIRQGWFNHPFNFDPVWLEECTGFEAKDDSRETQEAT